MGARPEGKVYSKLSEARGVMVLLTFVQPQQGRQGRVSARGPSRITKLQTTYLMKKTVPKISMCPITIS